MSMYKHMCAAVHIWRSKSNLGRSLTLCCMCQAGMPISSWRFSSLHLPSCQRHADYSHVLPAGPFLNRSWEPKPQVLMLLWQVPYPLVHILPSLIFIFTNLFPPSILWVPSSELRHLLSHLPNSINGLFNHVLSNGNT